MSSFLSGLSAWLSPGLVVGLFGWLRYELKASEARQVRRSDELRADMKEDLRQQRADMKEALAQQRDDMNRCLAQQRADMNRGFDQQRDDMKEALAQQRADMKEGFDRQWADTNELRNIVLSKLSREKVAAE